MKKFWVCLGLALALFCPPVNAAKGSPILTFPSKSLGRTGTVSAVFHFEHGLTGKGKLRIQWNDSLGRIIEDEVHPVVLTDEIYLSFTIDLSRAVAMKNTVKATLSLDEVSTKGTAHIEQEASVDFIAKPNLDHWNDYVIIMYQKYPSAIQPALENVGINAGQVPGRDLELPNYLIDNNMRWYSEQIGTDFYSPYHYWRSDRTHDWTLDQAKDLYFKDPTSKEAFKRNPSFWDPIWRAKIHDRLVDVAKLNEPYRPLFYSLADETGIGSLGNQWDFDFSDMSLVPMRRWLRNQYGTLNALNAEWETSFADWDHVTPLTTNEAMQRKSDNFAPWGDFKNWMDYSYAEALRLGVDAVHEVDPTALVGIVGAQKPGWGGYDYSRLSRVVSVMEPYDIGGSVKMVRSLNPSIPLLTTSFASGDWEKHRVWFELLQGERGLILWDEAQGYVLPDGSKGPAGLKAEGHYKEIRNGMGALIINSTAQDDGIAIHYSQASMRTEWLLERRPDGDAWMKRDASYERSHNVFLRLRESWGHAIEDQGLQYNFVSYLQVEEGELQRHGYRVLILPHSSSLSQKEVENIRSFVESGGVVIADAMPGTFDEHSRRLTSSPLADLFGGDHSKPMTITPYGKGKAIFVTTDLLNYLQDRVASREGATFNAVSELFRAADLHPEIAVTDDKGKPVVGLNVHTFTNGGVKLLTLQSSPEQAVDELGPADFRSNKRFEKVQSVHVHLPSTMYVNDVRQKKDLGQQSSLTVSVDTYEPTILTLTSAPQPHLQVFVPTEAQLGTSVPVRIQLAGTPSTTQIYHLEVVDPAGKIMLAYTTNLIASGGAALTELPLAKNDPAGQWTLRIEDMLTGNIEKRVLNVR